MPDITSTVLGPIDHELDRLAWLFTEHQSRNAQDDIIA